MFAIAPSSVFSPMDNHVHNPRPRQLVIVGMRPDVAAQMVDGWFAWPATSPRNPTPHNRQGWRDIPRLREGSDCDEDAVNIGPLKYSKGYGDYARTLVDAALAPRRDS